MAASLGTAQTFTAGVRGAVRESDWVVPGATVQLVNEASNANREAISNEAGGYNFSAVPPGTYTGRASLSGFKPTSNAASASVAVRLHAHDAIHVPHEVLAKVC